MMENNINLLNYHILYDGTKLYGDGYIPSPAESIFEDVIKDNKFFGKVSVGEYEKELGIIIDYYFDSDWIDLNYDLISEFEADCGDFCSMHNVSERSKWMFDDYYNDILTLFIPFVNLHDFPERNKVELVNRLAKENSPYKWFEERYK